jgi:hypothetical protein
MIRQVTKPQSYPFLAIAKKYGLDYGDVLLVADMWRHPANRSENEREADKRLFVACIKLSKQTVAKIERDISTANTEFRRIQAGEIYWLTGEPMQPPLHVRMWEAECSERSERGD